MGSSARDGTADGAVKRSGARAVAARIALALAVALPALPALQVAPAHALTAVPPGNRSAEQPAIPGASWRRTRNKRTTFDAKYARIRDLLATDAGLRRRIARVSALYGIEPVHVAGALVGEHTYNVDAYDRLQTYAIKAVRYVRSEIDFEHGGESVTRFVGRPEFAGCAGDSEALWTCREAVWDASFKGRTVAGTKWPDDRFAAVFFRPFYAGQTFGLGQMEPLQALKMSDRVAGTSRLPRLRADRGAEVYEAIMDPDTSLHYVAATIRASIDAYAAAGFDISGNPGITATLYNLGNPAARAAATRAKGAVPRENYYGWLVNDKEAELRALFG